ncbi:hypothetical protein [Hymenobacter saemangeumensis]
MKSTFQRILLVNLVVLLVLAVAMRLLNQGSESGLAFMIMMAGIIALQFFINALFGAVSDSREARQGHWLSALLVLLVGFGACFGGLHIPL